MDRKSNIGIIILLCGVGGYLIFSNEIAGITRAIIIGLVIGCTFALRGQFLEK